MVVNGIDTADISVVVQGAVSPEITRKCLRQLRKFLPGSEIILSTWEGTSLHGLEYDKVQLNKDPGGYQDRYVKSFTNNLLRQLVSTQGGVALAERKYILKLRSDLIITGTKFLRFFESFPERDSKYLHFSHRIIVSSFFSKKYLYYANITQPVPFHVSDWLAFGLAEDIRKLFCTELPIEPDFSWYLFENKKATVKPNLCGASHRFAPEQHITLASFQGTFPIAFDHYMDYTEETIRLSERLIANNYIILSPNDFSIYCGKNGNGKDHYKRWSKYPITIPTVLWKGLYRPYIFAKDYQQYCDQNYQIPVRVRFWNRIEELIHKE